MAIYSAKNGNSNNSLNKDQGRLKIMPYLASSDETSVVSCLSLLTEVLKDMFFCAARHNLTSASEVSRFCRMAANSSLRFLTVRNTCGEKTLLLFNLYHDFVKKALLPRVTEGRASAFKKT